MDLAEEENWNELLAFDDFLFTTIETFACSWNWLLQNICSFSIYEKVGFWYKKWKGLALRNETNSSFLLQTLYFVDITKEKRW